MKRVFTSIMALSLLLFALAPASAVAEGIACKYCGEQTSNQYECDTCYQCQKCGAVVPVGAAVCLECGTCLSCGAANEPGNYVCTACGAAPTAVSADVFAEELNAGNGPNLTEMGADAEDTDASGGSGVSGSSSTTSEDTTDIVGQTIDWPSQLALFPSSFFPSADPYNASDMGAFAPNGGMVSRSSLTVLHKKNNSEMAYDWHMEIQLLACGSTLSGSGEIGGLLASARGMNLFASDGVNLMSDSFFPAIGLPNCMSETNELHESGHDWYTDAYSGFAPGYTGANGEPGSCNTVLMAKYNDDGVAEVDGLDYTTYLLGIEIYVDGDGVCPSYSEVIDAILSGKAPSASAYGKTRRVVVRNRVIQLDDGTYVTVDKYGAIVDGNRSGVYRADDGTYKTPSGQLDEPTVTEAGNAEVVLYGGYKVGDLALVFGVTFILVIMGGAPVWVNAASAEGRAALGMKDPRVSAGGSSGPEPKDAQPKPEVPEGKDFSKLGYERDIEGNWRRAMATHADEDVSQLIYDPDGRLIGSKKYMKDGGEMNGDIQTDASGNAVSSVEKWRRADGTVEKYVNYRFDQNGNVVERTVENADHQMIKQSKVQTEENIYGRTAGDTTIVKETRCVTQNYDGQGNAVGNPIYEKLSVDNDSINLTMRDYQGDPLANPLRDATGVHRTE